MFFKEYFKSISDVIEAKYKGHSTLNQNNADKGELCEIFIRDFLVETLGDSFKISRGGKIIDHKGNYSKQMDVLITAKKSLKLFHDKGIYPTETVCGVVSVTSTLKKNKLIDCLDEFISIPKKNYQFSADGYFTPEFIKQTESVWKNLIPFKIVFAYSGKIEESWTELIRERQENLENSVNSVPDLIIVNKVGFIEKDVFWGKNGELDYKLNYVPFENGGYENYGVPFSKMLYHLNNLSHEEILLKPNLEFYFNADL